MMILQWALSGAVLSAVLLALRYLLRGRIRHRLQYALWLVLAMRLLLPFTVGQTDLALSLNRTQLGQDLETIQPYNTVEQQDDGSIVGEYRVFPAITGIPGPRIAIPIEATPQTYSRLHRTLEWRTTLHWTWSVGCAAVLLWFGWCNDRFSDKLKKSRVKRMDYQLPWVKGRLTLPVYVADVETPCLYGPLHPAIYVPKEVAEDEAAMAYVLAHEATHYRHGDHVFGLVRGLCLALHWFDPLVWWAAWASRQDAELACDEAVTSTMDDAQRANYGRTLIALSCGKDTARGLLLSATTMTGGKRSLKERIACIAQRPRTKAAAAFLLAAAIILAVVCTFTGASKIAPEEPYADTPVSDGQTVPGENTADDFTLDPEPFVGAPVSIEPADYGLTDAVLKNLYIPDWGNLSTEAIGAWYLHTDGAGAGMAAVALADRFDTMPLETMDYLVKLGHQKVGEDYAAVVLCKAIATTSGMRATLSIENYFALYSTAMQKCRATYLTGRGAQLLKLMEASYAAFMPKPSTVTFGSYRQDWSAENGGVAPIEWLVLSVGEDGKLLLLSKYCLWLDAYAPVNTESNWANSTLRTTLNTTFLQEAFIPEEQAKIAELTTHTPDNTAYGYTVSGGADTRDKVFLLSIEEAEMFLGQNEVAYPSLTPYAEKSDPYGDDWDWWLRSPGSSPSHPAAVHDGVIGAGPRSYEFCAVRPAMWIYAGEPVADTGETLYG